MNVKNKIKLLIDKYEKEDFFSGVILVKKEDEVLYSDSRGYAHKGFNIKNTLETRFDTASITKIFTAAAIFQLIDKGKLTFDDKILDIIDIGTTKISKDVTIHHLLNHMSGIGDDADEEAGEDYEEIWRNKPNYSVRETVDFLPNFIDKQPNFRPGEGHRYNNVGYILLGLAIEKISGRKYREYIVENIFKLANMENTEFCCFDGIFENVAEGYAVVEDGEENFMGWRKNIYSYPPIGSPDSGAYTTVLDLDKFIRCLRNGQLFSKVLSKEIFNVQAMVRENENYKVMESYGYEAVLDKKNDILLYSKDGCNPGVANKLVYYPQEDLTIAIMANQDCNVWNLHREIKNVIFDK